MLQQPPIALLAGLMCALAIFGACGRDAGAACGDWLSHSRQTFAEDSAAPAHPGDAASEGSGQAPCDGSHCRRAPSAPVPPSPAPDELVRTRLFGPAGSARQGLHHERPQFPRLAARVHALKGFFPAPDPPPRVA